MEFISHSEIQCKLQNNTHTNMKNRMLFEERNKKKKPVRSRILFSAQNKKLFTLVLIAHQTLAKTLTTEPNTTDRSDCRKIYQRNSDLVRNSCKNLRAREFDFKKLAIFFSSIFLARSRKFS